MTMIMIMYDVADDNDNGDDECHCQLLKYCDAFHYKINFPSTWVASYQFSRGGKRARSNRSSWSLTHSEVNREKTYPFFSVFFCYFNALLYSCLRLFGVDLNAAFFITNILRLLGADLNVAWYASPYQSYKGLMRIWYTWVVSRKACRESGIVLYSIFVTYIEYSTFRQYSTYFLCFAWSILPVPKPQRDDVPLILLSSIGGTRIWEIFRGRSEKLTPHFLVFTIWIRYVRYAWW